MSRYPLSITLNDGTEMVIREMVPEDEEKSLAFFRDLPIEDRQYLRVDVTDPEQVKLRTNEGPLKYCWRLVAEGNGKIWADATIYGYTKGWRRHLVEIRCIIHPKYKRRGLGGQLIWELFQKALSVEAEVIYCEVVPEQLPAVGVLEKLGFKQVLVRKGHVKDLQGKNHDLHIYIKHVKEMWSALKHHYQIVDVQYPRG